MNTLKDRKASRRLICVAAAVALFGTVVGCSDREKVTAPASDPEVHAVTISPDPIPELKPGGTVQLSAEVSADEGVEDRSVLWEVNPGDADCIEISESGLVTALKVADRPLYVTATCRADTSVSTQAGVRVVQFEVYSFRLTPQDLVFEPDDRDCRLIVAELAAEPAMPRDLEWTSDDTDVATVDPTTGQVCPVGPGVATITAKPVARRDWVARAEVAVKHPGVESIIVTPERLALEEGGACALLHAEVRADDGVSKQVRWTSNDPSIATVDSTGQVCPIGPGTTTVRATSAVNSDIFATADIEVAGLQPVQVSIARVNGPNPIFGRFEVEIQAESAQGIRLVELLVDDVVVGRQEYDDQRTGRQRRAIDLALPVESATVDRSQPGNTLFKNGNHELKARATDHANQVATSVRNVTLSNENTFLGEDFEKGSQADDSNGNRWHAGPFHVVAVPIVYDRDVEVTKVWSQLGDAVVTAEPNASGIFVLRFEPQSYTTRGGVLDRVRLTRSTTSAGEDGPSEIDLTEGVRIDTEAPRPPARFDLGSQSDVAWVNGSFGFATGFASAGDDGVGGATVRFEAETPSDQVIPCERGGDLPESTAREYRLWVIETDALGNSRTTELPRLFGVDLTPPVLRLASGSARDREINPDDPVLPEATDALSGAEVFGHLRRLSPDGEECDPLHGSCEDGRVLAVSTDRSAGYYSLSMVGRDGAGNTSGRMTVRFAVDHESPRVLGVTPPPVVEHGESAALTFSATDNLNLTTAIAQLRYAGIGRFIIEASEKQLGGEWPTASSSGAFTGDVTIPVFVGSFQLTEPNGAPADVFRCTGAGVLVRDVAGQQGVDEAPVSVEGTAGWGSEILSFVREAGHAVVTVPSGSPSPFESLVLATLIAGTDPGIAGDVVEARIVGQDDDGTVRTYSYWAPDRYDVVAGMSSGRSALLAR